MYSQTGLRGDGWWWLILCEQKGTSLLKARSRLLEYASRLYSLLNYLWTYPFSVISPSCQSSNVSQRSISLAGHEGKDGQVAYLQLTLELVELRLKLGAVVGHNGYSSSAQRASNCAAAARIEMGV